MSNKAIFSVLQSVRGEWIHPVKKHVVFHKFQLRGKKGMGRQLQGIYCKHWKLLLSQLSAYQCLILIYLYKNKLLMQVMNISSTLQLLLPNLSIHLKCLWSFDSEKKFQIQQKLFKLLEESSGLIMKKMSLFYLVFGPVFIIRKRSISKGWWISSQHSLLLFHQRWKALYPKHKDLTFRRARDKLIARQGATLTPCLFFFSLFINN